MMRYLKILFFVHFIVSVSSVDANPEIIQTAEKLIALHKDLTLKCIPPGCDSYKIFTAFCTSSGLVKIIDDVRVLLSELHHRTTRQDSTVKSLFVEYIPKRVYPALPMSFYEFSADANLQQARAVSLDQFCLQNSDESEDNLYDKLKNLLLRIKEKMGTNRQLENVCIHLKLHDQLSELIKAIDKLG